MTTKDKHIMAEKMVSTLSKEELMTMYTWMNQGQDFVSFVAFAAGSALGQMYRDDQEVK